MRFDGVDDERAASGMSRPGRPRSARNGESPSIHRDRNRRGCFCAGGRGHLARVRRARVRPLNGPSIKVQRIGTRKDKAGTQTGKRNIIVLSIRPAAVRRSLITPARSHLPRAQRGGNQAGRPPMSITQSKCMTRFGRGVDALAAACANARVQNFDRHETSLPAQPSAMLPPTAPSYCPSPIRPSASVRRPFAGCGRGALLSFLPA